MKDKMKKWVITPEQSKVEQKRRKESNYAWFYRSKHWKVARNKALQTNPICQMCEEQGITREANTVNHITPMRIICKSGAESIKGMRWSELKAATNQNNLESLCLSCHGIEESEMIKREKEQLKEKEKKVRQELREQKKRKIDSQKRNWHDVKDNFKYYIGSDKEGNPIYMDIF